MSNREAGVKIDVGKSEYNVIEDNNIVFNKIGASIYRGHNIISNNYINNNYEGALELNWDGTNNRIINNEIYSNRKYGIFIGKDGTGGKNNLIISNNIYYNTNGIRLGVDFQDNPNVKNNNIYKNNIYNNYQYGLLILSPHNLIYKNSIYGNGNNVKLDYGGRTNTISGNNIYSAYIGIQCFREYNIITNNDIHNLQYGIMLEWDSHHNSIIQNNIYNNTLDGINRGVGGSGSHYNIFYSNIIYNNGAQGISFSMGVNNYNRFIENLVYSNHGNEAGIRVDGSYNSFLYNICYSNNGSGILIKGKTGSVTNKFNKCYANKKHGIELTNVSGGYIMRNAVYKNSMHGIYIKDSHNCLIYHNSVASNDLIGGYDNLRIDADSTAGNKIMNNIFAFARIETGYGIYIESGGSAELKFNNVYGNITGNYGGTASAGTGSVSVNPKWISYDFNSTNFLSLTSISMCIDAGTNLGYPYIGASPDMGWKEFSGSYVRVSISKTVSNILLSGNYSASIPGASLQYKIMYSITTNLVSASNLVIYDKLSSYVTYSTDIPTSWIVEYSTNDFPEQNYNSPDYTNERPQKVKIRWIRWKKQYSGTVIGKIVYKITIK